MAVALGFVCLWLILATAFGLVARRCRAVSRTVSITAWVTSACSLLAALVWTPIVYGHLRTVGFLPELTFLALIAFGITAHRPFGPGWSIPAAAAGLLGAVAYTYSPAYKIFSDHGLTFPPLAITVITLIPLAILGIAMCRTRIEPPAIN